MRLSGTLNSWNDARGFGFIAQSGGGADIFVHVSEFSLGGNRPVVGEKLSYELGHSPDGKPQATKVVRLEGGADRSSRTADAGNAKTGFSMVETCALAIIVAIIGIWCYQHFSAPKEQQVVAEAPALPSARVAVPAVVTPAEVVPAAAVPVEVAPAATTPAEVAPAVVAPAVAVPAKVAPMVVAPAFVAPPVIAPVATAPKPAATTFRCDGRTHCSQMTSCAEATWFLNNCPGTKMDGDHDGIPCEQQLCPG